MYEFAVNVWRLCVMSAAWVWIGYWLGTHHAKAKKFVEIGTVDELVQDAVNKSLLKVGRDDKVNVADVSQYIAIVTKDGATFINLDIY